MHTTCIFCGANVVLIHVHGHYQCPLCKTNTLPCCDGDNCSNFLLADETYLKTNGTCPGTVPVINTLHKAAADR